VLDVGHGFDPSLNVNSVSYALSLHVNSVPCARVYVCVCVRACTEASPGQLG